MAIPTQNGQSIIVLDENFLAINPDVLLCCAPATKLYVTFVGVQKARLALSSYWIEVLNQVVDEKVLRLFKESGAVENDYFMFPEDADQTKIDFVMSVYELGRRQKKKIIFLSIDDELINLAQKIKIRTLKDRHFVENLLSYKPYRRSLLSSLLDEHFPFEQSIAVGIGVAAILLIGIYFVWRFNGEVSRNVPIGILVLLGTFLGFGLFWFRSRYRFSYGVVEIIFGILNSTRFPPLSNFNWGLVLQFATGIYIIVRGLDNIDKGMRKSELASVWESIFGSTEEIERRR